MGKQAVVAQSNAYARRRSQNQEQTDLKDVQPDSARCKQGHR